MKCVFVCIIVWIFLCVCVCRILWIRRFLWASVEDRVQVEELMVVWENWRSQRFIQQPSLQTQVNHPSIYLSSVYSSVIYFFRHYHPFHPFLCPTVYQVFISLSFISSSAVFIYPLLCHLTIHQQPCIHLYPLFHNFSIIHSSIFISPFINPSTLFHCHPILSSFLYLYICYIKHLFFSFSLCNDRMFLFSLRFGDVERSERDVAAHNRRSDGQKSVL